MSAPISSGLPVFQMPEAAKDFAHQSGVDAKGVALRVSSAVTDAADKVEETIDDAKHTTKDAFARVTGRAKEMVHTVANQAGETFADTREYVRRNPVAFVLGSLAFGVAVGYLIINARRKPSFGERFADEPLGSVREVIRDAFAPVAHRVHEGYDSAREGVGKVMNRMRPHRSSQSLSDRIGRAAHNMKFW